MFARHHPLPIPTGVARQTTIVLVALLFFGTLMPGHWRSATELAVNAPGYLGMLAHVVLFAAICFLLPYARFWRVAGWHVLVAGLALALTTEGLQFFAIDRRPGVDGLLQDMLGAALGWALGLRWGFGDARPLQAASIARTAPASVAATRRPGAR